MKRTTLAFILAALAWAPARAQDGALSGPTGLLTVPTAQVVGDGQARAGISWHDARPDSDGVVNYLFNVGFLPGLEIGGRAAQFGAFEGGDNDLSFNAKYAWRFDNGFALASGAQDIGGEAPNFRSRYAVATLPWRSLSFTAGYGWGPDLLEGALGGLEWRPASFAAVYAEYDADEVNPGLRLESPPLWGGLRLGLNAGYRGATHDTEGAIQLRIPLGRAAPSPAVAPPPVAPVPPSPPATEGAELRAALEALGFEAVRTGTRGSAVLVVALENRRYNHSAADGIGLALGTIAVLAPPGVERIELALQAWGVPQLVVATAPKAYRDFLRDGAAPPKLLDARYGGVAGGDLRWHNSARLPVTAELVIEPVLRTFVATERGMIDAALGVRARATAALDRGVVGHIGVQLPLAQTGDFDDGRAFAGSGPEAGLDLLMLQYAYSHAPAWTTLWSVGLMQVIQVDLGVLGFEQAWSSPEGRHRLSGKLMLLNAQDPREVVLAGYTWFVPERRFSAALTGGRFYAEDVGVRLDLARHFDDTIVGVFLKVEDADTMAGGFQLSIPLTPRRDAAPTGLQVKGPRRWGHGLQTTLNRADGTNVLRPLMLYEPVTEFDLRRDFLDSNRLGPAWLQQHLPRMREAWQRYAGAVVMPAAAGIPPSGFPLSRE